MKYKMYVSENGMDGATIMRKIKKLHSIERCLAKFLVHIKVKEMRWLNGCLRQTVM